MSSYRGWHQKKGGGKGPSGRMSPRIAAPPPLRWTGMKGTVLSDCRSRAAGRSPRRGSAGWQSGGGTPAHGPLKKVLLSPSHICAAAGGRPPPGPPSPAVHSRLPAGGLLPDSRGLRPSALDAHGCIQGLAPSVQHRLQPPHACIGSEQRRARGRAQRVRVALRQAEAGRQTGRSEFGSLLARGAWRGPRPSSCTPSPATGYDGPYPPGYNSSLGPAYSTGSITELYNPAHSSPLPRPWPGTPAGAPSCGPAPTARP